MEYLGVSTVFGERARASDLVDKSMVGHTLFRGRRGRGGVHAVDARTSGLPPTINYNIRIRPSRGCGPNVARDAKARHALSSSFGFFGGQKFSGMGREPM